MRKVISLFCIFFLITTHSLISAEPSDCIYLCEGEPYSCEGCYRTCPQPGCYPSAPVCGTRCAVSVCSVAFTVALLVGVASVIVLLSQESSNTHAPNI